MLCVGAHSTLRWNGNGNKYNDWPSASLRSNGKIEKFRPFIVDMRAITQTMIDGRSGNLLWLNPSGIFSPSFSHFYRFAMDKHSPTWYLLEERERLKEWTIERKNIKRKKASTKSRLYCWHQMHWTLIK